MIFGIWTSRHVVSKQQLDPSHLNRREESLLEFTVKLTQYNPVLNQYLDVKTYSPRRNHPGET